MVAQMKLWKPKKLFGVLCDPQLENCTCEKKVSHFSYNRKLTSLSASAQSRSLSHSHTQISTALNSLPPRYWQHVGVDVSKKLKPWKVTHTHTFVTAFVSLTHTHVRLTVHVQWDQSRLQCGDKLVCFDLSSTRVIMLTHHQWMTDLPV